MGIYIGLLSCLANVLLLLPLGCHKLFISVIQIISFTYLLNIIEFISLIYHIFIVYISIGKLGPFVKFRFNFVSYFCIFVVTFQWSEDILSEGSPSYSSERTLSTFAYNYIIYLRCLGRYRSIVFPHLFFRSQFLRMNDFSEKKICLIFVISISQVLLARFIFAYFSKKRLLVVEGGGIYFITGISGIPN